MGGPQVYLDPSNNREDESAKWFSIGANIIQFAQDFKLRQEKQDEERRIQKHIEKTKLYSDKAAAKEMDLPGYLLQNRELFDDFYSDVMDSNTINEMWNAAQKEPMSAGEMMRDYTKLILADGKRASGGLPPSSPGKPAEQSSRGGQVAASVASETPAGPAVISGVQRLGDVGVSLPTTGGSSPTNTQSASSSTPGTPDTLRVVGAAPEGDINMLGIETVPGTPGVQGTSGGGLSTIGGPNQGEVRQEFKAEVDVPKPENNPEEMKAFRAYLKQNGYVVAPIGTPEKDKALMSKPGNQELYRKFKGGGVSEPPRGGEVSSPAVTTSGNPTISSQVSPEMREEPRAKAFLPQMDMAQNEAELAIQDAWDASDVGQARQALIRADRQSEMLWRLSGRMPTKSEWDELKRTNDGRAVIRAAVEEKMADPNFHAAYSTINPVAAQKMAEFTAKASPEQMMAASELMGLKLEKERADIDKVRAEIAKLSAEEKKILKDAGTIASAAAGMSDDQKKMHLKGFEIDNGILEAIMQTHKGDPSKYTKDPLFKSKLESMRGHYKEIFGVEAPPFTPDKPFSLFEAIKGFFGGSAASPQEAIKGAAPAPAANPNQARVDSVLRNANIQ